MAVHESAHHRPDHGAAGSRQHRGYRAVHGPAHAARDSQRESLAQPRIHESGLYRSTALSDLRGRLPARHIPFQECVCHFFGLAAAQIQLGRLLLAVDAARHQVPQHALYVLLDAEHLGAGEEPGDGSRQHHHGDGAASHQPDHTRHHRPGNTRTAVLQRSGTGRRDFRHPGRCVWSHLSCRAEEAH